MELIMEDRMKLAEEDIAAAKINIGIVLNGIEEIKKQMAEAIRLANQYGTVKMKVDALEEGLGDAVDSIQDIQKNISVNSKDIEKSISTKSQEHYKSCNHNSDKVEGRFNLRLWISLGVVILTVIFVAGYLYLDQKEIRSEMKQNSNKVLERLDTIGADISTVKTALEVSKIKNEHVNEAMKDFKIELKKATAQRYHLKDEIMGNKKYITKGR